MSTIINQNLGIDLQYYTIALEPFKNTQSRASSFVVQKNSFFNNKLTNNNKTPKTPIKLKAQLKAMPKGKKRQKQPDMLKIKKMNQQIDKKRLTYFFIRKPSQLFNLKDENTSL